MRIPLVLLCVFAGVAAACGGDNPSLEPPEQTTSAPADTGDAGGALPALPEARVVREGVRDARPRPFEEAVVDETDDSLHVIYFTGVEPCNVLADVAVVEEPGQVSVTLFEGHLPDASGQAPVCIEIAERVSAAVPLDAPLGDRVLIDAATGEPVPVSVIRPGEASAG